MTTRTLWVHLRVNRAEKALLEKQAAPLSVAAYLRKLAGLDSVEPTTFSAERQPLKRGNRYTKNKAQKGEDNP